MDDIKPQIWVMNSLSSAQTRTLAQALVKKPTAAQYMHLAYVVTNLPAQWYQLASANQLEAERTSLAQKKLYRMAKQLGIPESQCWLLKGPLRVTVAHLARDLRTSDVVWRLKEGSLRKPSWLTRVRQRYQYLQCLL